MKKKPRKAAGNFLEGRAGLACLRAGLRAECAFGWDVAEPTVV